jgi:hypothetical protein
MKLVKVIMVSLLTLSVAACSTAAIKKNRAAVAVFQQAFDEQTLCYETSNTRLSPLLRRMKSSGLLTAIDQITIEHKLNKNFFPEERTSDFLEKARGDGLCQSAYLKKTYAAIPILSTISSEYFEKVGENEIALLTQKITIGEYHTQRAKDWREYQEKYARGNQEYTSGVNYQSSLEAAHRQRVMQSIQQQQQQRKATTCHAFGNTLKCKED